MYDVLEGLVAIVGLAMKAICALAVGGILFVVVYSFVRSDALHSCYDDPATYQSMAAIELCIEKYRRSLDSF